jgi:hypothetical protein
MINVHIYGHLKKKFDENARLSENTIISVPNVENENFSMLLTRLNVDNTEIGDCFVNSKLASDETIIPDGARVALFSSGMVMLCGGQHLRIKMKGYGLTTKSDKVDYY